MTMNAACAARRLRGTVKSSLKRDPRTTEDSSSIKTAASVEHDTIVSASPHVENAQSCINTHSKGHEQPSPGDFVGTKNFQTLSYIHCASRTSEGSLGRGRLDSWQGAREHQHLPTSIASLSRGCGTGHALWGKWCQIQSRAWSRRLSTSTEWLEVSTFVVGKLNGKRYDLPHHDERATDSAGGAHSAA